MNRLFLLVLALTLPLAGAMAANFTDNTAIGVGDTTYDGQEIVVSGCTLTVDGPHGFASLWLTNGAVLTHSPAPNGETNNRLQLTLAGDCVIANGSAINVAGRGYAQALGPGAGPATSSAGVGAGYGGLGGAGTGWLRTGGGVYGSLFAPMDFGSGGGRLVNHSEGGGSSGGGAVFLSVAGTLTVEGVINASGADVNHWTQHLGGAGSGGSIYLVAASLQGGGSIVADGGNVAQNMDYFGGGGGGGRVALHLQTNSYTGTRSTKGGLGSVRAGEGAQSGGAGTVCLLVGEQPAVVTIHNGGRNGMGTLLNYTQWPTNWLFRLEAAGSAIVYPAAPLTLAGLLVADGAVLSHSPAPNGEANNRLQLTLTGDCVIASDGAINAVGCGYGQALGPGAGPATSSIGVGAGYGGMGGAGTGWLRTGGGVYGSLFAPMDFGSGGGRLVNHSEGAGSSGGGAVFLSVAGTLAVEGGINASGFDINHWTQSRGGAGSGGSIYLVASSLTGSGSIVADGGNVAQNMDYFGGGGGGGRVAVRFDTNTFSGTLSAKGGRGSVRTGEGAQSGGAGTVCLQPNSIPTATVWVNNGGNSGNSSGLTRLNPNQWPGGAAFDLMVCSNAVLYPDQPLTLASLNVTSGARLGHAPMDRNLVLTVLGNALLDASSSMTADGCGYPEASGPGAGGSSAVYYGSGAGHGGVGGWSAAGGGGPGGTYDSYFAPTDFGSGGGRSWNGPGGPGGGAVRLTVGGEFRLDGIISVKGQRTPSDNGGGGGSGGSVYLTAGTLLGDGFISVRGGDGGAGVGGGGAGGRVAIYHQGIAGGITNQIDRMGGTSVQGEAGGWGTLYVTNQYLPLDILTQAPTGTVRQAVSSVDVALNQPVRSGTFTTADVAITTPSGAIPTGDITVTPLSAASFRVAFPSQSALGAYQVQVGPNLENLYGQEMAAAYTGSFSITNPVISGVVRWSDGAPLNGVLLSATGGLTVTTGTDGAFTLSVPPGWSGTVTPALAGWRFMPPSLAWVNLAADATDQNFTARPNGYLPSGLLSWWRGEGDTSDIMGLHPGTPVGGLSYTNGPVGRAFAFNGHDAAVALGNWFDLQTFTLSLWVQPAPGQVSHADIMDNNHTDDRSWCLQYDDVSDATLGQWHWGASLSNGITAIGFGLRHSAWQHWTLTLDTNRVQRLYLDGQIVGSTTNAEAIAYDGTQSLNLGRHPVYGRYFSGALDEVMVFNRALEADEVTSLYVSQGGPPTLDIQRQDGSVQLSWPTADLFLQSSPSLTPAGWQTVTDGIQSDGSRSSVTVPATTQDQFFRLKSRN